MSKYYRGKRSSNIYDPNADKPFKLSRSKIDGFLNCPRCFYIDRRLGVDQPPGYPFNLNSAVDNLLKTEFDLHRAEKTVHPMMEAYGIDAVPYQHPDMDLWRDSLRGGIQYLHEPTKLLITGGVDDVWVNPQGELIIVDYKATSKDGEVSLDADWQIGYKRQMEIYQWLFRRNGFKVSKTGYFVYCNGRKNAEAFDGKLEFDVKLIPYEGDDSWVEGTLMEIKVCLDSDKLPSSDPDCDFCKYRYSVQKVLEPFKDVSIKEA
jgi:CRISPR/Cas system-associated exonuclease Cas4 (RecB family)